MKINMKKLASCAFLTLLFSMTLNVVGAEAFDANCQGIADGVLQASEDCDPDTYNAVPVPVFRGGLYADDTDCRNYGFAADPGNLVICDEDCNIVTTMCEGGGGGIGQWGDKRAPEGVPTDIKGAIMNVTNWILGFVAIIATLVIIYGGVLYLTAAGNEDSVATAKKTISFGIIGIVICGLAYAMVIVVSTVILSA